LQIGDLQVSRNSLVDLHHKAAENKPCGVVSMAPSEPVMVGSREPLDAMPQDANFEEQLGRLEIGCAPAWKLSHASIATAHEPERY
jgi:hypothetical protein